MDEIAALEASIGKQSLADFGAMAWGQIESRPFVDNWHLHAIADHLMAVSAGEIPKLIINIPPRHMKSLSCNVFWPSWDWLHNPWRTFLFASYRVSLSERDNKTSNRLLKSDWFKERFDPRVDPLNDTNTRWGIIGGGERLVTSVGGASSTGEGGDGIVIDDPISADAARHPKQVQDVIDWWDETIKSRLNDPKTGFFVVIMQRLRENDLSGHILAHETGWDHLCLPARYEPDHKFPVRSSIGFKDPRTKPGELLNPKRFDDQSLSDIAKPGTFQEAGQLQQRPAPREGGLFKRANFRVVDRAPSCVRWVRAWDLAASEQKTAARTAGILVGVTSLNKADRQFVIGHAVKDHAAGHDARKMIERTAKQDSLAFPGRIKGSIPKDPGAGGKVWAQQIIASLAGHHYRMSPEIGEKVSRAEPVADQVDAGNVLLVKGEWNKEFLDELELFPNGKFADQVDALSRAFLELTTEQSGAAQGTQS